MLANRVIAWTVLGLMTGAVGSSWAQNYQEPGSYGDLELTGGFLPDPHAVQLVAGGDFDASSLGSGCVGQIAADAPDISLQFSQPQQPLNIYAISESDTTLVIRAPNGQWLCNDDANDLNPLVTIPKPVPGRYAIWVGAYSGGYESAQLYISELEPIWNQGAQNLEHTADPIYGHITLEPGFTPDPHSLDIFAGGTDPADAAGSHCAGYIAASNPDVRLTVNGTLRQLHVFAHSDADTTLVVRTPAGEWLCNDDSHHLHPAINIAGATGEYAIWVGTFSEESAPAQLLFSASAPRWEALESIQADGEAWHDGSSPFAMDFTGMSALEIFHALADTLDDVQLTWRSAEGIGDSGLILEGVHFMPDYPEDDTTLQIGRVILQHIDLDAFTEQRPPLALDLVLENMLLPADDLKDEDWAEFIDLDVLDAHLALAYALDESSGILNLQHLRLTMEQLGTTELQMQVGGFDLDSLTEAWMTDDPTRIDSSLVSLGLSYQDQGMLRGILQAAARDENQSLQGLIERLIGEMRAQILELELQEDPLVQAATGAIESFMRDLPDGDGGRLHIQINPVEPLDTMSAMMLLMAPTQAAQRLGLTVEYLR